MMILRWMESFRTGIPVLDNDHKTLINVIALVRVAVEEGAPVASESLAQVLEFLFRAHFEREEMLIARTGYRNLEPHRICHGDGASCLAALRAAIEAGQLAEAAAILEDLETWLIGEIVSNDLSFASYVDYFNQGHLLDGLPRLSARVMV